MKIQTYIFKYLKIMLTDKRKIHRYKYLMQLYVVVHKFKLHKYCNTHLCVLGGKNVFSLCCVVSESVLESSAGQEVVASSHELRREAPRNSEAFHHCLLLSLPVSWHSIGVQY